MKPFKYHEPKTEKDACSLLFQYGNRAIVLAGGTDLIPKMKRGLVTPGHVVNIKRISGLDSLKESQKGLHIGALTTISYLAHSPLIWNRFPLLNTAVVSIGSTQVRNIATLGGNICNAASSADMVPGLMVLNAIVRISGLEGYPEISIEEFFTGAGKVDLKPGEILKEVYVPFSSGNVRSHFKTYLKQS